MANRYWVGGTGTWDATAGSKWALTSGGAGGQAVPTSADNVFFDAASGANTVTIGAGTATCNQLTMTGFTGTIAFGTNSITIAGGGTIYTGATTFSVTGTPLIDCTYSGSVAARTISPAATTEANSISFNISAGTGQVTISANMSVKSLNFTGFTGTLINTTKTIYGNLTLASGMTINAGGAITTFAATSGTQTITSAGQTQDFPITFAGTATYQLQDDLTIGSTRSLILTSGTLSLNNKTLTAGIFSSSNTNTRSILFGTGNITLTGSATTIWSMATLTGFTYTGTPTVNCTYSGSTGTRTINHGATAGGGETVSVSFNISAGSDVVVTTTASFLKNLDFTGFNGTLSLSQRLIYGSLVLSSGMTVTGGANTTSFMSSLTTQQNITSAGQLLDFPISFGFSTTSTAASGTGSVATLTFPSTSSYPAVGSTIFVTGMTPTGYNGTYTVTASSLTSVSYANTTTGAQTVAGSITTQGITFQLQDALTLGSTRAFNCGGNTLDLNNKTFSCGNFTATNTSSHSILFGTAQINVTGSNLTVWTNSSGSANPFTYTGTGIVNCTYSGSTGTRLIASIITTEANALSFNIPSGSDIFAIQGSRQYKNIDFTGFTGYVSLASISSGSATIYGNFTMPAAGASPGWLASSVYGLNFGSASATQILTTNGYPMDTTITRSGAGTLQLAGDLNLTSSVSTGQFNLTSGVLNSNSKNITCNTFNYNTASTKTLTLTNSTVTVTGGTSSTGFVGSSTGTTYNVTGLNVIFTTASITNYYIGTAAGYISQVTMSGSGQLILGVSGGNSNITTLTNTVTPCTVSIVSGFGILGITNFNLAGTAGNLVTFNSTTAGTQATISKTTGSVNAQYLSIQDSNATGGATWRAANSVNAGNNSGWLYDYYDAVNEPVATNDSQFNQLSLVNFLSESVNALDETNKTLASAKDLTESSSANDQTFNVISTSADTQESGDSSDTVSTLLTAIGLVLDSLTAADQYDYFYKTAANQSESVTLLDKLDNFASQLVSRQESGAAIDSTQANYIANVLVLELHSVLDTVSATFIINQSIKESSSLLDLVFNALNTIVYINEASSLTEVSNRIIVRPANIAESSTGIDASTVLNFAVAQVQEPSKVLDQYNVAPSIYNVQVVEPRFVTDQTSNNALYVVKSSANSQAQLIGLLIKTQLIDVNAVQQRGMNADMYVNELSATAELLEQSSSIDIKKIYLDVNPNIVSASISISYFKMTAQLIYTPMAIAA